MKVIITAILLGILMHSFAQECELMPPAENFNAEQYFNIPHVYVTRSQNGPNQKVCREYDTTNNNDGTTTTQITSDYKTGGVQHKTVIKCTNKPKSGGSSGQFSVDCEVQSGSEEGKTKYQLESSVFATDNVNYAFLQVCKKTESEAIYDLLLLQTDKDSVHEGVTSVFTTTRWNIDDWVSRKNVDCNNIVETGNS